MKGSILTPQFSSRKDVWLDSAKEWPSHFWSCRYRFIFLFSLGVVSPSRAFRRRLSSDAEVREGFQNPPLRLAHGPLVVARGTSRIGNSRELRLMKEAGLSGGIQSVA